MSEDECKVLQEEEAEVLTSIYEGDPAFVTVKAGQKYQYKCGDPEADRWEQAYSRESLSLLKKGRTGLQSAEVVVVFCQISWNM